MQGQMSGERKAEGSHWVASSSGGNLAGLDPAAPSGELNYAFFSGFSQVWTVSVGIFLLLKSLRSFQLKTLHPPAM